MRGLGRIGRGTVAATIVACAAIPPIAAGAVAQAAGVEPQSSTHSRAQAAGTLNGTDTAHLRLVHQNETLLYEEGAATGAIPGLMRATLTVGPVFKGSCTIDTRGGSITGRGTATPHGSGRYQSFSGSLLITGGTGRYAHAHGRTGLSGTFDRRTFSLVIQTTGDISY
jgi:hypothetical protein